MGNVPMTARLTFDRGTLELTGIPAGGGPETLPGVLWDPRTRSFRAPAYRMAEIEGALARFGLETRTAAAFALPGGEFTVPELRPYQRAALDAWELAGRRGTLVLPTGAGKTRVALAAIATQRVATLCLVPTRILLHQWQRELETVYGAGIGCLGDGARRLRPITVATYESAYRFMARIGHRFALLVVDEAHHFGLGQRDELLEMCVAPMRLGLTATPITEIEARAQSERLIGREVYRLGVLDLAGRYLAELELVTLEVELGADELRCYQREMLAHREVLRAFLRAHPEASWADFARAASGSDTGRRALAAFHRAQAVAHYNRGKARMVGRLLARHRDNRCLVFTADNDAAYAVSREHLVMPITCDIGRAERDRAFELFGEGRLRALVSARVLNEGLDLPDADVAIIVAGRHGAREHVQRIGRVLRPKDGKRAVVYELLSRGTSEVARAERRRSSLVARTPPRLGAARERGPAKLPGSA
jgi:superfamily II DNA or RNA helicase